MGKLIFFVILLEYIWWVNGVQPNMIVILTDDQDVKLGSLKPMKKLKRLVAEKGVTFTNAFANSPICCPSRSSFLTGLYQHNHHVLNNSISGNCSSKKWQQTYEKSTFAVFLKNKGYSTFYAGKYLNQYGNIKNGGPEHIPPGWSEWIGLIGNSKYYNYTLSINGKKRHFRSKYLTNVLKSYSIKFLRKQNNTTNPFLMVIAPPAPHHPFTPEPKYEGYFDGIKVPRTIQFNYCNNSDKHWLLQMSPSPLPVDTINLLDEMHALRWESLLSVDDLVESVIQMLRSIKKLNNTYIFFISDNGFHLGQLSLAWDKRQLYEFDINVPLIIRGPGIPKNHIVSSAILVLDIAPTLLHLGGLDTSMMDGVPFLPLKKESGRIFLIEYHGEGRHNITAECFNDDNLYGCSELSHCKCQDAKNNTYSCLRGLSEQTNFIYCEFSDKENSTEAYDLNEDPYQLNNIVNKLTNECKEKLSYLLRQMTNCENGSCRNVFFINCPIFHS